MKLPWLQLADYRFTSIGDLTKATRGGSGGYKRLTFLKEVNWAPFPHSLLVFLVVSNVLNFK